MSSTFSKVEMSRVQEYLQEKFSNVKLALKERKEVNDSVEVTLAGEFIGTIYKDEEDGDVSYDFNMAILEMDLPAIK